MMDFYTFQQNVLRTVGFAHKSARDHKESKIVWVDPDTFRTFWSDTDAYDKKWISIMTVKPHMVAPKFQAISHIQKAWDRLRP